MPNRLAGETSPYLLQHKDNPVDWYPWGPEALERARREDKPILLSIGYAACHWCHVMEHESFEDPDTAAIMNEHFVCIKVDREERPDLDSIYMDAVQRLTGHGGWPMTMFLTPEGIPFEGGTYFPKEQRHGLPSFTAVLHAIARVWKEKRALVEEQGRRLLTDLDVTSQLMPSTELLTESALVTALERMKRTFDPAHGGFGGPMKFPQPMTLDFLMRMRLRGFDSADEMLQTTLSAMASGGIFDQIGGGFHRYTVDSEWIVPHFEKMLYDNALLLRTYAREWTLGGDALYREIAEATVSWMLAEMRDPSGGFWSSLDADSEGEEGKFYVWSLDEVKKAVGDDFESAVAAFGFSRAGNFEGANIPVRAYADADEAVTRVRAKLMEHRSHRVRPATDTKVLTGWNGLAASALAESGRLLGRSDWVAAAQETMTFVLERLRVDGRLMRSFRSDPDHGASVRHLGYCEDYAFVIEACLSLYEATFEVAWLDHARWAADEAIRLFADADSGGFFTTGSDAEALVTRPKDLVDNAIPAANSVLALELQRLAEFTGNESYGAHASGILRLLYEAMTRSPGGFAHALCALDFYVSGAREIVVVGKTLSDASALAEAALSRYFPNAVLIVAEVDAGSAEKVPLLKGRTTIEEKATAYVCRNGTCRLPVTTRDELLRELAA